MNDNNLLLDKLSKIFFLSMEDLKTVIIDELKEYADYIDSDYAGNIIIKKNGKGKSINVLFEISPIGVLARKIIEDKSEFDILGNFDKTEFINNIVYKNNKPTGIIRKKNIEDKEDKLQYIEYFDDIINDIPQILSFEQRMICKDKSLYSINLNSIISCYIAINLFKEICNCDKQICFTIWNSSISSSLRKINNNVYNLGLFVSSISSQEGCLADKGASVCVKDGCYVLNSSTKNKINDILNKDKDDYQFFIGKSNPAMEEYSLLNFVEMIGVYYPIMYKNTKFEQIFSKDIEKTLNLLLKIILNI